MKATEWYLNFADEARCYVLLCFEGWGCVCKVCFVVCVVHKYMLVQTPRPLVSALVLNLACVRTKGRQLASSLSTSNVVLADVTFMLLQHHLIAVK